jgi:hypothetical protein
MRAFGVRFVLLGGIALGSQLGFGGSPAMAQTYYDFTFNTSNPPPGGGSIEFILSGQNVIGTVPGSGTGILSGGSLSTSAANNESYSGSAPMLLSTNNTPFFYVNTPNYVFIDTSSDQFLFASDGSTDFVDEYTPGPNGNLAAGSYLSNESLTELTPAPIPGAGILSYLVLGLAGLMFRGKALWWKSVTAMGNLRSAVRARFSPPDSALAASSRLLT